MQEANAIGLDGYLVKPVAPALLFETILAALGEEATGPARTLRTEALPSVVVHQRRPAAGGGGQ